MHVCVYICIPHIPLHTMSKMFIAVSVLFIYLYIYIRMVYPVGLLCMYMCKCVYIYIYDGYPLGLHALMLINIISYGDPIGLLIL